MKNYAPLLIAIASVFSFGCFAQHNNSGPDNMEMGNAQFTSDRMSGNGLAVVSYHVEERVKMAYSSNITTYNVSSLSLVNTNDLGPNNTRIITPKYGRAKVETVALDYEQPKVPIPINVIPIAVVSINIPVVSVRKVTSVNIDILSTYERVLDKGYKSVDMLKRVGNGRFFDGDLTIAAKWYSQLFDITTDLEAEYYYRYAQALKSISQTEKANEMMAIFENKNL